MEYGSHIKLLSLTMIAVMLITCAAVFTSEENDGSTYTGGINSSSESNPYTGIDFQFSYSGPGFLNNIYVLEGSYVSIDGEIDSGIPCSQKSFGSSTALSSANQKKGT